MAAPKDLGDFSIGKLLGQGAFARVYHVRTKQQPTPKDFALKVMEKKFILKERKMPQVQMERQALSELHQHPFIVHLYYSFHDRDRLYLVLDLCPLGELSRVIRTSSAGSRALGEDTARFYLAELVSAVQHVHSKGYVHRDIKPENILLSKHGHIKLTDFGTAKKIDQEDAAPAGEGASRRDTFCGTAEYVSPEVLKDRDAGVGADWWAVGVCLFCMLVGRTPFWYESEFLTFQCILEYAGMRQDKGGDEDDIQVPLVSFEAFPQGPTELSSAALDLVRALLQPQPSARLCGEPLLQHAWFAGVDFDQLVRKKVSPPPPALPTPTPASSDKPMLDGARPDVWLLLEQQEEEDEDEDEEEVAEEVNPLQAFLRPGERVVADGPVLQQQQGMMLTTRLVRRHLLVTSLRRVLLVDATAMSVKEELDASRVAVSVRANEKDFDLVCQPAASDATSKRKTMRTIKLRDETGRADRWKRAVEEALQE